MVNVLAESYVVQSSDTCSSIARAKLGKPIYGEKGTLKRLAALNPTLQDLNLIYPGQTIQVGDGAPVEPVQEGPPQAIAPQATPASTPEPVVEKAPEKTPERVVAEEEYIPPGIELGLITGMTDLQATSLENGTRATLGSNLNLGVRAAWAHEWSEKFQTSLAWSLSILSFKPPTSTNKTLDSSSHVMQALAVGGSYRLSESLFLQLSYEMKDQIFITAKDSTTIALDSVSISDLKLGLRWRILEFHRFELGFVPSFSYLFSKASDGYSVHSGQEYAGRIYVSREFAAFILEGSFGLVFRDQNTDLVTQTETDTLLGVTFRLK